MGYIEFARLESSVDDMHAAIVSPAVVMVADVHCQRPPAGAQWLHICAMISSSNCQLSRILYSPTLNFSDDNISPTSFMCYVMHVCLFSVHRERWTTKINMTSV